MLEISSQELQTGLWISEWLVDDLLQTSSAINRIGGVIVSLLSSSAVDCGFIPRLCHVKKYVIGIVASTLSMEY